MSSTSSRTGYGFTLVELMVTIGLVSLLAAIAIPQYQQYKIRMLQSEAKEKLSAIYSVEMAFKVENFSFTGCLRGIGYTPTSGQTNYTSGFSNASASAVLCGSGGALSCLGTSYSANNTINTACSAGLSSTSFIATNSTSSDHKIPDLTSGALGDYLSRDYFTAAAVGSLSGVLDSGDQWLINQDKALTNNSAVAY